MQWSSRIPIWIGAKEQVKRSREKNGGRGDDLFDMHTAPSVEQTQRVKEANAKWWANNSACGKNTTAWIYNLPSPPIANAGKAAQYRQYRRALCRRRPQPSYGGQPF